MECHGMPRTNLMEVHVVIPRTDLHGNLNGILVYMAWMGRHGKLLDNIHGKFHGGDIP